jgi:hypothetical protein
MLQSMQKAIVPTLSQRNLGVKVEHVTLIDLGFIYLFAIFNIYILLTGYVVLYKIFA